MQKNIFTEIHYFFRDIVLGRGVILEMVRYDFRAKYLGSYLGILWPFLHPIITIVVLWFVFTVGFKSGGVDNIPFVPWLATAMIPWFYFSDTVNDATSSILANAFLVKKTDFRLSLLPIVKLCANAIIHGVLILVLVGIFVFYGFAPKLIWLQFFYYYFAMCCLILGLSWITSSMAVFTKDVNNVVAVTLQIGFWATPIFWNVKSIPQRVAVYLEMNPLYYITNGYRNTFLFDTPFWREPIQSIVFWLIVACIWMAGFLVYRKLRPHFADVI